MVRKGTNNKDKTKEASPLRKNGETMTDKKPNYLLKKHFLIVSFFCGSGHGLPGLMQWYSLSAFS